MRAPPTSGSGWEDGRLGDCAARASPPVAFDHPLWVLYCSGTTGLPKAIVHGQGGILLEQLKKLHLHLDAQAGDRVFWFTTTGWMMWNFLVGVLLTRRDRALRRQPRRRRLDRLWDLAAETGMTCFGTSASYIASCMKAGVEPAPGRDLSALRAVGSTGSPLAPEGFEWVYDHVGATPGSSRPPAAPTSAPRSSAASRCCPSTAASCRRARWAPTSRRSTRTATRSMDEVGELVITAADAVDAALSGATRTAAPREAYFDMYPGIWRHGDWIEITDRGTAIIYGRSDSTINRGGVRMGTSEIYRAVLAVRRDRRRAGGRRPDGRRELDAAVRRAARRRGARRRPRQRIAAAVREDCSPRHVPNEVHAVAEVPRTLSGKVLEVPVKRILMGGRPSGPRAATRSPTPQRSTSSSSSPASRPGLAAWIEPGSTGEREINADALLALATGIAHEAGAVLREAFGRLGLGELEISAKSTPTDLVSEADVSAER